MVDAGVFALDEFSGSFADRQLVTAVYTAMRKLEAEPSPRASQRGHLARVVGDSNLVYHDEA
jgi:hypothetical protein